MSFIQVFPRLGERSGFRRCEMRYRACRESSGYAMICVRGSAPLPSPLMPKPPLIAVIADTGGSYVRGLIEGITSYGDDFGPWSYRLFSNPFDTALPKLLRGRGVDGVLARVHLPRIGRELARLDVPVVDMLEEVAVAGIPQIVVNDRAVARLALEHLIKCGLRSIAFVGLRDVHYSEIRRRHLIELCRERAGDLVRGPTEAKNCPQTLLLEDTNVVHTREGIIGDWLDTVVKPLGLVCCNDVWAAAVLGACQTRGVEVPEQVAVIGVDNDPVVGQVSSPTLSTVDPNTFKIGYQAAAMLHGMMTGGAKPPPLTYVDPATVVGRRSTDVLAYPDSDVVSMVRYVRDHACDGLTVAKMVKKMGVSRRKLERLFAEHVGQSPSDEINHVRLARVQQLLVGTDISLEQVARAAGFAYAETMRRAFKARFGLAPGEYRLAKRPKGKAAPPKRDVK